MLYPQIKSQLEPSCWATSRIIKLRMDQFDQLTVKATLNDTSKIYVFDQLTVKATLVKATLVKATLTDRSKIYI